jgi:uncharacterized protein YndB with AHSA1/START domain
MRTETRSITIAATPATVFGYVADPRNLPDWAPAFAGAIRADREHWIVTSGDAEFAIAVEASKRHGTVDLLRAEDPRRGAFTRVVPSGEGSAYIFTLHFPDGTDEAAVAAQMETVEEELRRVRERVE